MKRETDVSHFFVTCNNRCCVFTLPSHDDILNPHETLTVYRMKFVIVQVSWSFRPIAVLAPTIDHNSMRGFIEVSLVLPFCLLLFVCV